MPFYPGGNPETEIEVKAFMPAGDQGTREMSAIDPVRNTRFFRAPWAVANAPLDEDDELAEELTEPAMDSDALDLVWAEIQIDPQSSAVIQCENKKGAPYRKMLHALGIEKAYDRFKYNLSDVPQGTSLTLVPMAESSRATLMRHDIRDVERLATTSMAELTRLLGKDIGARVQAAANKKLSTMQAEAAAAARDADAQEIKFKLTAQEEQIKLLTAQLEQSRKEKETVLSKLTEMAREAVDEAMKGKKTATRATKSDRKRAGAAFAQAAKDPGAATRPGLREGAVGPKAPADPEPTPAHVG